MKNVTAQFDDPKEKKTGYIRLCVASLELCPPPRRISEEKNSTSCDDLGWIFSWSINPQNPKKMGGYLQALPSLKLTVS